MNDLPRMRWKRYRRRYVLQTPRPTIRKTAHNLMTAPVHSISTFLAQYSASIHIDQNTPLHLWTAQLLCQSSLRIVQSRSDQPELVYRVAWYTSHTDVHGISEDHYIGGVFEGRVYACRFMLAGYGVVSAAGIFCKLLTYLSEFANPVLAESSVEPQMVCIMRHCLIEFSVNMINNASILSATLGFI